MNFFLKDMLSGGELLRPIYRTECNRFLDRLDFHPHYEVYFCHGNLRQRMFINGKEYTLCEPNVVILPPFAVHHISSGDPLEGFERYVIYFNEAFLAQFGMEALSQNLRQSFRGTMFRVNSDEAEQLLQGLQGVYGSYMSRAEQTTAFALWLNRLERTVPRDRRILLETMNEELPQILAYISSHVSEPLNADEIARQFHISRAKLDRDFRRYVGKSVHTTVMDCRLSAAVALLKRSDLTVAEVAARSGFESECYFYAFCKRNTGMTPTELRKSNPVLF